MTRLLLLASTLLAGGVDLPKAVGGPIIARESEAFRAASKSLSADDEVKFWDLVDHHTDTWRRSKQLSDVQSIGAKLGASERVLLMTGKSNAYLLVAEASKAPGGLQLSYSASWEGRAESVTRSKDWWGLVSAAASAVESTRTGCTPRLGSKDNAVVYLEVSRPEGTFEVITYGLPPASPASATADVELSSCSRAVMSLQRLLEEPATSTLAGD